MWYNFKIQQALLVQLFLSHFNVKNIIYVFHSDVLLFLLHRHDPEFSGFDYNGISWEALLKGCNNGSSAQIEEIFSVGAPKRKRQSNTHKSNCKYTVQWRVHLNTRRV